MRTATLAVAALMLVAATSVARTLVFEENRGQAGLALPVVAETHVDVSLRLDHLNIDDVNVGGTLYQRVSVAGVTLPNDEGAPDLPSFGRLIAVPNGATPTLEIVSLKSAVIRDVNVLPAPAVPLDANDSPLIYVRDEAVYSIDAHYPEQPARLSGSMSLRGVSAVMLGITPFQYNPVSKELVVHTEIDVRVTFEGGDGTFGEDRLRSRYWEPVLAANLANYESLPEVEFGTPDTRDTDYEYVIIVPDDPVYVAWGDSLARFRRDQGVDAGVVTLSETGATAASIEAWIDTAYASPTPPAAVLLLADHVPDGETTGITSPVYDNYCVSDNIYGDTDGDHLPEIVMARMTADIWSIEALVRKAIDYERDPPMNPDFYGEPVLACAWQDDRWYQVCTEVVYGYLANVRGKTPVREYAIYSGTPGTYWSSDANTYMLENYFGPDGLGYLPVDSSHLTDWGGDAARLNADINSGAFMVHHRGHANERAWGKPSYHIDDLAGLTNDDHSFLFSVNCSNGKFDYWNDSFVEVFHRMEHGALGAIAASEFSFSFVNDAFLFGVYDEMWPDFDPGYPASSRFNDSEGELRPAFANASGKHYLAASGWPSNPELKEVTYHLYHAHCDAFTRLYSEVPQPLTVEHQAGLAVGDTAFSFSADAGAIVALTIDGDIVGVAEATGAPADMAITPPTATGSAKLTVTKANHRRHVEEVPIISPVTHTIVPPTIPVSTATLVTVTVWDDGGYPYQGVVVTVSGWGVPAISDTTDANGEVVIDVLATYGEDLSVTARAPGDQCDCVADELPVTGAPSFASADVEASVPSIPLYGVLAAHHEGLVEATSSESGFHLMLEGCGVSDAAFSDADTLTSLPATPTSTGTVRAAVGKAGFEIYLEDIDVQAVYGQLAGSVFDELSDPLVGATVKGYAVGADTAVAYPVFEAVSGDAGAYVVEGDLEAGHYDVYISKFGYVTWHEETFVAYGENNVDYYVDFGLFGLVSGTVTEMGTGLPLEATVRFYRADNMELCAETTSDSLAGGSYSAMLPYFDYDVYVRAYHHIPESRNITLSAHALTEDFALDTTLADILVISDEPGGREERPTGEGAGDELSSDCDTSRESRSASRIAADLVALGYEVAEETAAATDPLTWLGDYDLVVSASGDNMSPIADSLYRSELVSYVAAGGKLVVEGGEVVHDALRSPGYPMFAADVLHCSDWNADPNGELTVSDGTHPVATFPNAIGTIEFDYVIYGDQDAGQPAAEATTVCSWTSYPAYASVIVYDDNPDPSSGQVVSFLFDYLAGEPAGMAALLENAVTYLLAQESEPVGTISGQVCLGGMGEHSGILVAVSPGGNSTYTGTTGHFVIEDLYDATYTVTATKEGWSTAVTESVVVFGGGTTGGVNAILHPVEQHEHCGLPALAIPDSLPGGVYDSISFTEDVVVAGVEIYVDITHPSVGDLIVEVTSPEGTTVRLHNRTGGTTEDIVGWYDSELTVDGPGAFSDLTDESSLGDWTLWVSDNAGGETGTVNQWCVRAAGAALTGAGDEIEVPSTYVLRGVFPNPFNPVTSVVYASPGEGRVLLAVYNVAGRLVRTLVDGSVGPGYHSVVWDGRDQNGVEVGSGVYFCRMETPGFDAAVKMTLLK